VFAKLACMTQGPQLLITGDDQHDDLECYEGGRTRMGEAVVP
jgi:hypothetical protein